MSRVFIAYKHEDEEGVAALHSALKSVGLDVWWDKDIPAGDIWRQRLETEIDSAACVLVVWSVASTGRLGHFVKDEANRAMQLGKLLQVRIGRDANPPLGFGEHQALDLIGWNGDVADQRFQDIAAAAKALTEGRPVAIPHGAHSPAIQLLSDAALPLEASRQAPARDEIPGRRAPFALFVRRYSTRKALWIALISCVLAIGVAAALHLWWNQPIDSLAVMPFADSTMDKESNYLSPAITEELTGWLLDMVPNVKIRGYGWAAAVAREGDISPASFGRRLDVDSVLAGNISRSGGDLIISVELIAVRNNKRIWQEEYRELESRIVPLESEIGRAIADKLQLRLNSEKQRRLHRPGGDAYKFYLRARAYLDQRSPESLRESKRLFQRAIAEDGNYALAYSGLADAEDLLGVFGAEPLETSMQEAEAAARKALHLDPSMAEAHATLASVMEDHWKWHAAQDEYRKAIDLNPNYATAHQWYGMNLAATGSMDSARRELQKAEGLEPFAPIHETDLAWLEYLGKRYDVATRELIQVLKKYPDFGPARWRLGLVYEQRRMFDEATHELQTPGLVDSDDQAKAVLVGTYYLSGRKDMAQRTLGELLDKQKRQYVAPSAIAAAYLAVGRREDGLHYLDEAYNTGDWMLAFLMLDPRLDEFRLDDRFQELAQKVRTG